MEKPMTFLSAVLIFKIIGTFLFLVGPLLLLPTPKLLQVMKLPREAAAMTTPFRYMGIAYFAIAFGYAAGLPSIAIGRFPWEVVTMGLISNIGGTGLTFYTKGYQRSKMALITMIFTGLVALGLIIACVMGDAAIAPL
tara:strand:- start:488 stop:901 length:414 start_codon:yes stop_codon:yes gene_type:complete